jgi:DNA replication licensing factor MCM3
MEYLPPFEKALNDLVSSLQNTLPDPGMEFPAYQIGLEGDFGDCKISPRNLKSEHLGKTVCMEALVTRC